MLSDPQKNKNNETKYPVYVLNKMCIFFSRKKTSYLFLKKNIKSFSQECVKAGANRSNISSNIVNFWCLMKCLNGLCMYKIFTFFKKEEKFVFDGVWWNMFQNIFSSNIFLSKKVKIRCLNMFEMFGGLFHQILWVFICGISQLFAFRIFRTLFERRTFECIIDFIHLIR